MQEQLLSVLIVSAFLTQFSFLAAFFWLNVMCVDIARTFSGLRSSRRSRHKGHKTKFLWYCIYAWGTPVAMSVMTAIMEFEESVPKNLVKPDFGTSACWFHTRTATLIYFYIPVAILLFLNAVFFIFTAFRIIKVQRETAILNNTESGRHNTSSKDRKRLILYLKLFCLMGVTWITEIISFAHGVDNFYYYVTDCINLLRGIFIFVIFCCKKKILRSLRRQMATYGVCSRLIGKTPSSGQAHAGQRDAKGLQSSALNAPVAAKEAKNQELGVLHPQPVSSKQETENKPNLHYVPVSTVPDDEITSSDLT